MTHIVPSSIVDAFAQGDMLQVVFFAILFGVALAMLGEAGKPLHELFSKRCRGCSSGSSAIIMLVAPIGAFGAMAYTIGAFGVSALLPLGRLMLGVYMTMVLFIFVVLNLILRAYGFSLWEYLDVHSRRDPDRARHVVVRSGAAADAGEDGAVRLREAGRGPRDSRGLLVQPRRHVDLPVDGVDLHRAGVRRPPRASRSSSSCSAC